MFLGTAFIYLTFCLVAFLPAKSQADRDTLIYFQGLDPLLSVQVLLPIRGNTGCSPGPSPALRDAPPAGLGDRDFGVPEQKDKQVLRRAENLPLWQRTGDLALSPSSTGRLGPPFPHIYNIGCKPYPDSLTRLLCPLLRQYMRK